MDTSPSASSPSAACSQTLSAVLAPLGDVGYNDLLMSLYKLSK